MSGYLSSSPYRPDLLALALGLLAALVCGVLLGQEQWLLLAGLISLIGVLLLAVTAWCGVEDRSGWLFAGGSALMLIAHVFQQHGLPVGYLLEVLIFGLMLASLRKVWELAGVDRTLRVLLILLILQLVLGIVSSGFGRSHMVAAIWQVQYNIKWPLMFGLGTLVVWNARSARMLANLMAWAWIAIMPFVLLEIAAPELHAEVFGLNTDGMMNPFFPSGRRYRGPFSHAGYLAIVCATLVAAGLVQWLQHRSKATALAVVVYFVLLLGSGQRQEVAALLCVVLFILAVHWSQYFYLTCFVAAVIFVAAAGSALYFEYVPFRSVLDEWGLLDNLSHLSERAILTRHGVSVAMDNFPLGSGLGTYGSAGAQKFDQSLFWELGFGRYWWFRQGKFLVDTYWPSVLAESGFLGAFALASAFVLLWFTLLYRSLQAFGTPNYSLVVTAFGGLTILLANSPSSAVITDPRGAFFLWLVAGAAWRATLPYPLGTPANSGSKGILGRKNSCNRNGVGHAH